MYFCLWAVVSRMGPESSVLPNNRTRGKSQIEVPSKYEGKKTPKLLYCEDDRALEEAVQRGCQISFSDGAQNSPGCESVQPAPGEPALAGDLG